MYASTGVMYLEDDTGETAAALGGVDDEWHGPAFALVRSLAHTAGVVLPNSIAFRYGEGKVLAF